MNPLQLHRCGRRAVCSLKPWRSFAMSPSTGAKRKQGVASSQDDEVQPVSPPLTKRKVESTTTQKQVANFFRPMSQKDVEPVTWRIVNHSLLVGKYAATKSNTIQRGPQGSKVAAFDFDSTLIKTRSGNKFAKDSTDWQWWDQSIPSTLRQLYNDGYQIVILSNQGGISLKEDPKTIKGDKKKLADFKARSAAVLSSLDLPISIYAATDRDLYRKPNAGMWHEFAEDYDLETEGALDLSHSIFVGDAGGRQKDSKGPADFSSSDRDLAANIGIPYQTPEEYFLKEDPRPFKRLFDPSTFLHEPEVEARENDIPLQTFKKVNDHDLVLLCGSPASGKSTFYFKHLQPLGYERVNQDLLKSRDKCLQRAREFLSDGRSVAVDNTNADPETRAHWIKLAQDKGIPIRCIRFSADAELCAHNDGVRALHEVMNPEKRTRLPGVAFRSFASRFIAPTLEEGFQDIQLVDFKFEGTQEQRAVWSKYHVS